ncbi:tropinone reductase, putative [Cordyceps militaris CM01]|uniref:Tropinone reductase, putative n=1 Tax=Cordyceps militaris (strain CM01) TaxID=983644 RepID=G3JQZ9_CORMM|nr:tropinone reductase, putative [Cordyceps militaris CM01]EGX89443.1 tropinone reductase, putative [Cordyceps militaris CM01]
MSLSKLPPRPVRNLVGKVAIVTGAGAAGSDLGNGRAIALLLAEDGASVICVDRDETLAQRTVEMIQEQGSGSGVAFRADVTSDDDCSQCVSRAMAEYGRLDILVNNVGILGPSGTAENVDIAAWAKGLEINVTSMMIMAKHAIPAMLKNEAGEGGIRGSIVNMGSVAGLQGGTQSLLYPTSKGAVVNMTRAMAANHGQDGIRVNCVCPGMVYTPMVYNAGSGMSQEMREARRDRSILRTEGNAWDVASAVRFLAGNEARWITGTILTVDAGATCAGFIPLNH